MLRFYITVCIGLIYSVDVFSQSSNDYWKDVEILTWADFAGMPDSQSPYAANLTTGIRQEYSVDEAGMLVLNSLNIYPSFYPKLSWYKKNQVTDALLMHERVHFKITAIHAVLLKQLTSTYKFTANSRNELDQLYSDVEKKRQFMQTMFDECTAHGLNINEAKVWEDKVNQLLAKY
ncbi:MAG: hypothetical protein WA951_02290 [Leeuwenhoekiella sp.]